MFVCGHPGRRRFAGVHGSTKRAACLPQFRSRKTMKLNGRDIDFMMASLGVHQFPPQ
jgi:hypothetical protein